MCGRFVQAGPVAVYASMFDAEGWRDSPAPRYNLAPTQPLLACRERDGRRELRPLRWGLVPHWSKGPDSRYSMINARAETVHRKPAYRGPFRSQRCLIPAETFYEWRPGPQGRQPYAIRMKSHEPFAFAGLWDAWQAADGSLLESCTLIVTDANALVRPIHDRMPVILPAETWARWLDPGFRDVEALGGMLRPFDADRMEAYPVSPRVNSPSHEGPELLEPLRRTDG